MKAKAKLKILIILLLNIQFEFKAQVVDYSNPVNWAVLPTFENKAIQPFIKDSFWIRQADVFYVYPTLHLNKRDTTWNISIENSKQRDKVINQAVHFQASTWAESGRMFVPFYRQAHIRAYFEMSNGGREALLKAYSDVRESFIYYLKNYNQGRPIILAGHSQGSTHISMLLKEFFDGTDLQKQLVAAYMPGIGIDQNMYNSLKLLNNPADNHGFLVWNTFKKKLNKDQYEKWYKGKMVINPVTWDLSAIANKERHKGFLFWNEKMYCKSFSTHLIDGAIWITTPRFPYRYLAMTMDDFHAGDVNLFWEDIRVNSKLRLRNYFNVTKGK